MQLGQGNHDVFISATARSDADDNVHGTVLVLQVPCLSCPAALRWPALPWPALPCAAVPCPARVCVSLPMSVV